MIILFTIESSFQGGAPRDLPQGPSSGSPLNPLIVTPSSGSLSGVRNQKFAYRQTSLVEGMALYLLVYIPTIILIIKTLKIANSAKASNSAIFLTGFLIRIYDLVD